MPEQRSEQESAQQKIDQLIAGLGDWRGECLAEVRGLFNAGLAGKAWWAIALNEHDTLDATAFRALFERPQSSPCARGIAHRPTPVPLRSQWRRPDTRQVLGLLAGSPLATCSRGRPPRWRPACR
jgi:hypothetical protein